MLIRDHMTKFVDIARPEMPIAEIARKMRDGDYGVMPVGENDRLVGMITDRDITVRAVAEGLDPEATSVREVMSQDVRYCFDDQSTEEVVKNMRDNQVRRLPVLNREKRLVGIIALGDIAEARQDAHQAGEALAGISEPEHREPAQERIAS